MKTMEITYLSTNLICMGEYTEAEPQAMYDSNMEGYEGSDSTFEIIKVETVSGDDVTNLIHQDDLESIGLLCLESL